MPEAWAAHLVGVGFNWDGKVAAEPQVCNLEERVWCGVVDQQVLRLEVAVHGAVAVHVHHPLEQLIHEALQGGKAESSTRV
jgi:hypothetical protein